MIEQVQTKVLNRWLVVFGAIIIQLSLGALYAWSAFTGKLNSEPFNLSKTQTQIIFSIGIVTFALVMALVAGRWQKKVGPRKVTLVGGIIMGLGYVIGGLSGTSFTGILIGVGILGGAGVGLCYVCPIAALVKWFPDKKGFITGLAVAGFGFGALIWIKLTSGFAFGEIGGIQLNLTPGWNGLYGMGWTVNNIFMFYGILFAILLGLGSLVMINPPEGWSPAGWQPSTTKSATGGDVNFTEGEMVRTPQFWILFLTYTAGAMAGLMVIGIIGLFGKDQLAAVGTVEAAKIIIITGTAWGFFGSLFNGVGRIAWGSISDFTGRRNAMVLMSALQGIMMIAFSYIGRYEWGLYIGAAVIGFNYGGYFALLPAATADYFGNKNFGTNYPWVFMAYGVGGIIGPILGGLMGDKQAWLWAFIPAGIACLAMALLATQLKAPKYPNAAND